MFPLFNPSCRISHFSSGPRFSCSFRPMLPPLRRPLSYTSQLSSFRGVQYMPLDCARDPGCLTPTVDWPTIRANLVGVSPRQRTVSITSAVGMGHLYFNCAAEIQQRQVDQESSTSAPS